MAKTPYAILILGITLFPVLTAAQVTTYYGAEKVFMDRCGPEGTAPDVQKACKCLMKSIMRNVTIQDFNSLEERAQLGQLSETEIGQKSQLIAKSRPALQECMDKP